MCKLQDHGEEGGGGVTPWGFAKSAAIAPYLDWRRMLKCSLPYSTSRASTFSLGGKPSTSNTRAS